MAAPIFFILAGTKTRMVPLGDRAEYCPRCLHLSRFEVRSVQQAKHLYYVPLGYHEQGRIKECGVCGAELACDPTAAFVPDRLGLDELLQRTNPGLTPERVAQVEAELDAEGGPEARLDRAVANFLRINEPLVKAAGRNVSLLTFLAGLGLLAVSVVAFTEAGPWVGLPVSVAAVALAVKIHRWETHRAAARKLGSRLRTFLACKGLSLAEFERRGAAAGLRTPSLQRHLRTAHYDELRQPG